MCALPTCGSRRGARESAVRHRRERRGTGGVPLPAAGLGGRRTTRAAARRGCRAARCGVRGSVRLSAYGPGQPRRARRGLALCARVDFCLCGLRGGRVRALRVYLSVSQCSKVSRVHFFDSPRLTARPPGPSAQTPETRPTSPVASGPGARQGGVRARAETRDHSRPRTAPRSRQTLSTHGIHPTRRSAAGSTDREEGRWRRSCHNTIRRGCR
jgi:hypothetical protein